MSRKLLHFTVFIIIIFSLIYVFSLCYNKNCIDITFGSGVSNNLYHYSTDASVPISNSIPQLDNIDKEFITSFAFISDTHLNSAIFPKLKTSLIKESPSIIIHAGDLTDYGTSSELSLAKSDLQSLDFPFLAIPGDHDIAESSSDSNFKKFFSLPYFEKAYGINILFLHNYYNFTYLPNDYLENFLNLIENSNIIVTSQPLFVPSDNIFSSKFMGSSEAFTNLNSTQIKNLEVYNSQRNLILDKIRKVPNNLLIISGDHHRSSTFQDTINRNVHYHILGSLSEFIYFGNSKISQKSLQSNRYTIVEIFRDKNSSEFVFNLKEIEI